MNKSSIAKANFAILAIVAGYLAISRYRFNKALKAGKDALRQAPAVTPEIQDWMNYVEKYPNLADDPKIKRAIDLLETDSTEE